VRIESGEADQHNASVNPTQAENEFTEVFVRRKKNRVRITASTENRLVICSRLQLGNEQNLMAVQREDARRFACRRFRRQQFSP